MHLRYPINEFLRGTKLKSFEEVYTNIKSVRTSLVDSIFQINILFYKI